MREPTNTSLTALTDAEVDHVRGGSHLYTFEQKGNGAVQGQNRFEIDTNPELIITPSGNVIMPGQGKLQVYSL